MIYSGFIGGTIGGLANVITRIQRFIGATEDLFDMFDEEGKVWKMFITALIQNTN